ncbi:MAG: DUF624 domain-containing protein [Clostridia bacterium]|nr:DUF624 domain-containing protein [Clostridia bacterium]
MRLPKFRLFDYETPGPGVEKDAPEKKGLALFWDIFSRRAWKMISLNAMYTLFSVPSFLIHWFMIYFTLTLITSEQIVADATGTAVIQITYLTTSLAIILYALFGGGAVTSGMTYVLRQYRKDTHSWLWTDFISTYKKYFVKSTIVFVIDSILLFLCGINFYFYGMLAGESIVAYLLQGFMIVVFLIFLLMHSYIYTLLVSYEKMSIRDIYKNSFILAIGKLPITLSAVAISALICALVAYLCFGLIYAIIIVGVILFAFVSFINMFITYPTVEKYLGKSNS